MYSTLDGAKKCAKQLKRLLDNSGLTYQLAKCQAAVAKAGGYHDWHDLTTRIGGRAQVLLPYDYWGRLVAVLPEPCRFPVRSYLGQDRASIPSGKAEADKWARDVLPYVVSIESVHRAHTSLLRPGSGKDQKLRLDIISGMLLNVEGHPDFTPKLDPECLTIFVQGEPSSIIPKLGQHPRFGEALDSLIVAGILAVEDKTTHIFAPQEAELRAEIIRRARVWNSHPEPEIEYFTVSDEIASEFRRQDDIDRAEAGPKVPYDELDYRGILLQSRYSVASEFETMKAVVDAMPADIRLRVSSIWCDSKACSVYSVEIVLGMYRAGIPEKIRECFLIGSCGFNGLLISHGDSSHFFDPEWPDEDAYHERFDVESNHLPCE